jgi:hypothetical protein
MNSDDAKLQEIAQKVIGNIKHKETDGNFTFVITVLMIISIILTLIRVIQECNKSKIKLFNQQERCQLFGLEIKEKVKKRSWLTRMAIKKAIRKELSSENYKIYGNDIMNAILETGEVVTEDEVITLMEAANV